MGIGLKLFIGVAATVLGLGYLYRPDVIERINALLRATVFNDAYIALERKKWAIFFLLVAFLFLYMGIAKLAQHA